MNVRLASLVSIVRGAGLPRRHRSIVNQIKQMLPIPRNNCQLLAVLAHGIELIVKPRLELLARDVAQLGLGDQALSLGAHQLLLQHHDARAIGLLVLELGDLVRDLLLAVARRLHRRLDVADRLHRDAVLVVAVDELVLQLADLVDQHAELVGHVGDVVVAVFAPDGELLLQDVAVSHVPRGGEGYD